MQSTRTIALQGGAIGTATGFDGTKNISIPVTSINPDNLSKVVPTSKGGTGNASGNAPTATKLQNARNIAINGAVSGSSNFDGSGNIAITTKQANIAVLGGKLIANGTDTDTNIAYPTGYNQNNCVVISASVLNNSNTANGYTVGTTNDSTSYVRGGISIAVSLRQNQITIRAKNINISDGDCINRPIAASSSSFNFKIVLMKIA